MTSSQAPILLFDLDGTVLEVNSFPYWAKWMLGARFGHLSASRRLGVTISTGAALARRRMGLDKHWQLKRRLQAIWADATSGERESRSVDTFVDSMLAHVRTNFQPLLQDVASRRYDGLLTTAAAEEYAVPLGKRLGFEHVISTRSRQSPYAENLGRSKRDNTLAELDRMGWGGRPRLLFTDHVDDMPLVQACDMSCWLGDSASLQAARALAPGQRIESGLNLTSAAMAALPNALSARAGAVA